MKSSESEGQHKTEFLAVGETVYFYRIITAADLKACHLNEVIVKRCEAARAGVLEPL